MNDIQSLSYFENLKNDPNAIAISIDSIYRQPLDDEAKFLYLNVIEISIADKYKYKKVDINDIVTNFLIDWIIYSKNNLNQKLNSSVFKMSDNFEQVYNLNKFSQIFSMVIVNENSHYGCQLLNKLFEIINPYLTLTQLEMQHKIDKEEFNFVFEAKFVLDLYLRILKAIHMDIADRSIPMTQQEIQRNAAFKDMLREKSTTSIISSIFHTVILYKDILPSICILSFEILGLYASWVDINLVANAAFLQIFLTLMASSPTTPPVEGSVIDIKENRDLILAGIDALIDILNKKMEPLPKADFLETIYQAIYTFGGEPYGRLLRLPQDKSLLVAEDVSIMAKKGKLLSTLGTLLLASWDKLLKTDREDKKSVIFYTIISKYDLMLEYLNCPSAKIAASILPFANDFINLLIKKGPASYDEIFKGKLQEMMEATIKHLRLPQSLNLDGKDEENLYSSIQESRKHFKVLFENIATQYFQSVLRSILQYCVCFKEWWNHEPKDVELCLTLITYLNDSYNTFKNSFARKAQSKKLIDIENQPLQHSTAILDQIIETMMSSRLERHPMPVIQMTFFEIINQYYRYFSKNPKYIPVMLEAFQGDHGIQNRNSKIGTRCLHIYCRLIKQLRPQLAPYAGSILPYMQQFINQRSVQQDFSTVFKPEDYNVLYEAYSISILSADYPLEKKKETMENMLMALMTQLRTNAESINTLDGLDPKERFKNAKNIVFRMTYIVSYIIHTTKAFSPHLTMKQLGVVPIYLYILENLLNIVDLNYGKSGDVSLKLWFQSKVRQYFHVMIVCLDDEIVPYIPKAFEKFMMDCDYKSIQELIPLVNQITSKYKKNAVPLLNALFMPLVNTIFTLLNKPYDVQDPHECSDRNNLQRNYYSFLANIIHQNNMLNVIINQGEESMKVIIETIIYGAKDSTDPVIQKNCFTLFRKFIDSWGKDGNPLNLKTLIYSSLIPACFAAPLKSSFDIKDAQTIQALNECAACIQLTHAREDPEFEHYLANLLSSLNITNSQDQQEFIMNLKLDAKQFRAYFKEFIAKFR